MSNYINTTSRTILPEIDSLINAFLQTYTPLELLNEAKPLLILDEKSTAYYIPCHLKASIICELADFEATIDGSDEEELYKLNRDITENKFAFTEMEKDAKLGRTFEDIVVEFDKSYKASHPLKIYGGQHRVKAIQSGRTTKPDIYHGLRVYFGLSKEQKVEIATINNTSIAVPTDLLDRMKEQLIGSQLRDFCQTVGLLEQNQEFADSKNGSVPTVRIARTLIVNFYKGKNANLQDFHVPYICKAGGIDEEYNQIRSNIDWQDPELLEAGRSFANLHKAQKAKVEGRKNDKSAQFASKAFSMTVVASWAYAAGLYSNNKEQQAILFNITNGLGASEDPLNAKALSEARIKGIDNDTYRGLGARMGPDELGRMLEVFRLLVELPTQKKITKDLANSAIQMYHSKKLQYEAFKNLR